MRAQYLIIVYIYFICVLFSWGIMCVHQSCIVIISFIIHSISLHSRHLQSARNILHFEYIDSNEKYTFIHWQMMAWETNKCYCFHQLTITILMVIEHQAIIFSIEVMEIITIWNESGVHYLNKHLVFHPSIQRKTSLRITQQRYSSSDAILCIRWHL